MSVQQRVLSDLSFFSALKTVLGAYQEVALMKMQDSRDSVLNSRRYLQELGVVYFEVKYSYQKELLKFERKRKDNTKEIKSAVVLLTPNEKLNGGMPYHVFHTFISYIKEHPEAQIFVVGSVGESLYHASGIEREYQTFELLYGETFDEDLLNLIYILQEYDDVLIFHGQFESLLSQQSVATSLAGGSSMESNKNDLENNVLNVTKTNFLFEPGIKDVVEFFDSQVRGSLLRQSVHESRLAQFASRANAMDEALGNVDATHKKLSLKARRSKRLSNDKKQLNQLSSILWSS